ncbi:uncharacterized protein LOC112101524 [Citrus clementina]|uniref:uncharacterized protein LOC112101524 n=1 Tax=Citrus clementina TaxID=85681 RepID=UPI000CECE466|nr:uncharacterized protein LOC112101524 [Citrus x clementina]
MIAGGLTLAGDSNRARKNYRRYALTSKEVLFNLPAAKRARVRQVPIMWMDDDEEGVLYPHEDALVIKATATGKEFQRILVDTRSSVDILFKSTLDEMGIVELKLEQTNTSLKGFGGGWLTPMGIIELPITEGSKSFEKTVMLDSIVVEEKSPYHMILGRPFMRVSQCVTSTHYLALQYRVNGVVGMVRGDQRIARSCYATAAKETLQVTTLDNRGDSKKGRQEPAEKLEEVLMSKDNPSIVVRIKSGLGETTREVYVDGMITKSKNSADHVRHLEETFDLLRKYQMKLNPEKCAFGVSSGKFLGFLISHRGIEANPEKNTGSDRNEVPRIVKEIMRKLRKIEWTAECEEAFGQLNEYLASAPLLSTPREGDELYLYFAVSKWATNSVLVREDEGKQHPVYYTSKALVDAETRYPMMEKWALALVTAAHKLRPYFQAHLIVVMTDQPLRQTLLKPDASGRLVK